MASPLAGQSLAVGDLSPAIGDSPIAKNAHPPALAFQRARGPGTLHAYAALMLACVMLLIAQAPSPADVPGMTLAEAIAYARALERQSGRVCVLRDWRISNRWGQISNRQALAGER